MKRALEFDAELEDGVIKIPKTYQKELKKKFRIIILLEDELPKKKISLKDKFKSIELDTKGFEFDRDEIHER
ncbi:MAG: hypothetical protein ABIA74_06275 [bacterium]